MGWDIGNEKGLKCESGSSSVKRCTRSARKEIKGFSVHVICRSGAKPSRRKEKERREQKGRTERESNDRKQVKETSNSLEGGMDRSGRRILGGKNLIPKGIDPKWISKGGAERKIC